MSKPAATKTKTLRSSGGVSVVNRDGKYYVRFRDAEGVRRMRFAGTSAAEARTAAAAEADQIVRERKAKFHGKALGAKPLTFEQFCHEYLPVLRTTMRPATMTVIATQVGAFDKFMKARGDKTLDQVTRADADAFLANERERGCAEAYLSRIAWVLSRLWRGAVERGVATENPFAARKFSRQNKYEVPYLTADQLAKVVALVKPRHRDIITVLAETGMRSGEAIGLVWGDLDLDAERPLLTVTRQGPERALLKTQAARRSIPLSLTAREVLARRRPADVAADARVFPDNDSGYNVLLSLHEACKAANQPRLRLHDLRHLFASHLVQAGVPMPQVARLLGHADGGALVAKRYGRWQPQDAEALAMDRLAAFRAPARSVTS
jgi:integrase